MLGLELTGERLGLVLRVELERVEAPADVVLEVAGLFQQALFQPREAPLDVAHVAAEEDVANLVQAGGSTRFGTHRTGRVVGRGSGCVRGRSLFVCG